MSEYMQCAETIHSQLGGRRFDVMTGARNFVGSSDALSFQLPRGAHDGINGVRIRLTADDLYEMTFLRARGTKVATVKEVENVYCDQLAWVFACATGLAVHLPEVWR